MTPNLMWKTLLSARIPELNFLRSGKVRDLYEVDNDRLLIVATDRISAFDCVLPNAIPQKGRALTHLSRIWFDYFSELVRNQWIASEVNEFPSELLSSLSDESKSLLAGRSMLVRRADV